MVDVDQLTWAIVTTCIKGLPYIMVTVACIVYTAKALRKRSK